MVKQLDHLLVVLLLLILTVSGYLLLVTEA